MPQSLLLLTLIASFAFSGCEAGLVGQGSDGGIDGQGSADTAHNAPDTDTTHGGGDIHNGNDTDDSTDTDSSEEDTGNAPDTTHNTPDTTDTTNIPDTTAQPETCDDGALTDWEQNMLDKHNEWRGSVAPPAANMFRVHWDRNIAQNAANWVSSCDPDWPHSGEDRRSNVGGYDVLGENLSFCAGTGCTDNPSITDGSGLGDGEGWWNERHDYNWADDSSNGMTSHYTQLTSSNIYAIGCATQLCGAPGPYGWDADWWWTICQYGPRGMGYWVGTKPYESGAGGLVEPPASVYDIHPGLCGAPQ